VIDKQSDLLVKSLYDQISKLKDIIALKENRIEELELKVQAYHQKTVRLEEDRTAAILDRDSLRR
jgi:hypothetical protein